MIDIARQMLLFSSLAVLPSVTHVILTIIYNSDTTLTFQNPASVVKTLYTRLLHYTSEEHKQWHLSNPRHLWVTI